MREEHFGIAVVGGMAVGLIPVVHASGGIWSDIVKYGEYGLGCNSLEEAIKAIEKSINNYWSLRWKVVERSKMFSKEVFDKKDKIIIEKP